MLFPTLDYVFFLMVAVLVYWALPVRARLGWLGLLSLAFYASWRATDLPLLLGVIGLGWAGALWIKPGQRGVGLLALAMIAPLLYYKYLPWFGETAEAVSGALGAPLALGITRHALPIGISFFTFQALAYVLDSRKRGDPDRNPWRMMTFIIFFPHLVAGPIVRAHELLPTLRNLPLLRRDDVGRGLYRIGIGMAKKILIADIVSLGMVDPLFSDPERFTGPELMLGLYAYTLQIYADFSAYSDIAVGSALLFGIQLPENFRRPYKAVTVAGFWRRWHMTLSSWVRDYVYFPLGGARTDRPWKVYRNLMLTMLILGIWHGASWNFVIYGLLHGSVVCVNRWQRKQAGLGVDDEPTRGWPWLRGVLFTFHFVVLARILFRAEDLGQAATYAESLLHVSTAIPRFSYTALAAFAVGYAVHFSPERWEEAVQRSFVRAPALVQALALGGLMWACATFGSGESLSFIYYSF